MKKIATIGILSMLLLMSLSVFSSASGKNESQINLSYEFDIPSIKNVEIGGEVYDRITMDDILCDGNPGAPSLPEKGINILIPQGRKLKEVVVSPGEGISLGSGFKVQPVEEPVPISAFDIASTLVPDEKIYQSKETYPGKFYTTVGSYSFRGYEILVLKLHPVQYIPLTGELFYYPDLSVSVNTVEDGQLSSFFRGSDEDEMQVMGMVDNPSYVIGYAESTYSPDDFDLLILTTDALKSGFEPLKEAHDATGVNTVIKTLTDVGSSDPDDIREYIRDAYNNWGIEYVLIGGDNDIIPAKTLYFGKWKLQDYYGPSDVYYSCLDGPFNYDGDNKWGEPNDGANGGDVDLLAEVYVGRACVGSLAEVQNFVDKTIAYMNTDPEDNYLNKVVMAGERLLILNIWPSTWGKAFLEELIDGCNVGEYTVGIPSDVYNFDKLYDHDWAEHGWPIPILPGVGGWPKTELISRINSGVHLISHVGHGNFYNMMKMDSSDANSLTNDEFFFIYSEACNVGGFDNGDCIGEDLTVKTDNGAFAGIFNARLGFELRFTTYGPTHRYQRAFWDAVFGHEKTQIGVANQYSKESNIASINTFMMRYCYYQLNLLGDPSVDLLTHYGNNENNNEEISQQSQSTQQTISQQPSNTLLATKQIIAGK